MLSEFVPFPTDVTLDILEYKPELAIERDPNGETVLHILARKPLAFSGKHGLGLWQKWIYKSKFLNFISR